MEPDSRVLRMKLWEEYFMYYVSGVKDKYAIYPDTEFHEDNIFVLHRLSLQKQEQLREIIMQMDRDNEFYRSRFGTVEDIKKREIE